MFCCQVSLLVLQSVMLGNLAQYFVQSQTPATTRDAYLYAMAVAVVPFLTLSINGLAFFQGLKIGMVLRVVTTAIIYQKVLAWSYIRGGRTQSHDLLNCRFRWSHSTH